MAPKSCLPDEHYAPFLSALSKSRKPNSIRGLYPLEQRPGMISLLAGKPAPQTFPVTSLSISVRSPFNPKEINVLKIEGDTLAEALQYSPTQGITSLQQWIYGLQQRYHKRHSGEGWTATVGTGSQDVLYKAFHALLNPGDPIFIEAPVYAGVLPILQSLNADLVEIPTDAEGLKTVALRETLNHWPDGKPQPKILYTVPYGCNPTGVTASTERRKELLSICREYNILIMEDDPYYYLYYGASARPPSYFELESLDEEPIGRVLRFDSLSKVLSAGLRLGFMCGPKTIVDAVNLHTTASNLQVSSTSQAIAVALLDSFGYDGFQRHSENISSFYLNKRDVFEKAMERHLTGLAEWSTPVSGMFIWFKLNLKPTEARPGGDSAALIRESAVARGVLALPGSAFFPNGQVTSYVRAAFSLLDEAQVDEALRRLASVIREYNSA